MLSSLKKLFGTEPPVTRVLETKEPRELATAALLIELARSDFSESSDEIEAIKHLLERRFGLQGETLQRLLDDAAKRAANAVSLHEFTHRLNRELEESDKLEIVEMLWRVSHADGRIDKHEEHLILRVAGLLHISDKDRVRLKLKVVVGE